MSSSSSSSSSTTTTAAKVFDAGNYDVVLLNINDHSVPPPPKPLLIATPSHEGEFPVLLFLHGYLLFNSFYSQLIHHVASHGFIVVAPQLYYAAGPDSSHEIKAAAAITDWFSQGLSNVLPSLVQPNLNKLGISGHSRGGKVAFALALGLLQANNNNKTSSSSSSVPKYSALIGIDPVDGMGKGSQTPPPVLTYVPRSFNLETPVLVVGSGLGEIKKNPLFPPCAPKGVNHRDFFDECRSPACYFVVKDYGHLDVLDDETRGIRGRATYCTCMNGKAREPMRSFVGGIMVAFMKAYLEDDDVDLVEIRDRREAVTPVEFQAVDFRI